MKSDRVINALAREIARLSDTLRAVKRDRDAIFKSLVDETQAHEETELERDNYRTENERLRHAVIKASASCTRPQRQAIRIALGVG